jgi:hypothetical protein
VTLARAELIWDLQCDVRRSVNEVVRESNLHVVMTGTVKVETGCNCDVLVSWA